MHPESQGQDESRLEFRGGTLGALSPFILYLIGVAWLSLSGAPSEKGFWLVIIAALTLGLLLTKDSRAYCEVLVQGMAQPITAIMILAWLLAGMLGSIMSASGFVESLIWAALQVGLSGGGYVAASFVICVIVSTAVGTSFGTIFICGPLLYPVGGALGAEPAVLIGAILGGATFGDNISPISDSTIASALSQKADMAGVVRSRMKYALPAAAASLVLYGLFGSAAGAATQSGEALSVSAAGLPVLGGPAVVLTLLLLRRHLVEALLIGILVSIVISLLFGLVSAEELVYVDVENYSAAGILIGGIERGIGVSILTFLLMGLVATVQATGMLGEALRYARGRSQSARAAEWWIVGVVSAATALTMNSVVAILTAGAFSRELGESAGIGAYRRANLMDITVCSWPFIAPHFLPAILAAGTTASGAALGMPRVSPFEAGIYNLHAWMLLAILLLAVTTGYGRRAR